MSVFTKLKYRYAPVHIQSSTLYTCVHPRWDVVSISCFAISFFYTVHFVMIYFVIIKLLYPSGVLRRT